MQWSDVAAVVPAVVSVPERSESLRKLLEAFAQQCPGMVVTVAPQWKQPGTNTRGAYESLARALRGVCTDWVLYAEEDVKLSSTFGETVLGVLETAAPEYGGISFFSRGRGDPQLLAAGTHIFDSMPFWFAQTVAVRREVAEHWRDMMVKWHDGQPDQMRVAIDASLNSACIELGLKIGTRLPSLVQHRQLPSAFGHFCEGLVSRTFVP